MDQEYSEMQLMSKQIQLDLAKGKLNWDDNEVQFFIPAALFFTDFDWLELIAENTLVEEDGKVVKNFLAMVKSLKEVNSANLHQEIMSKIKDALEDD